MPTPKATGDTPHSEKPTDLRVIPILEVPRIEPIPDTNETRHFCPTSLENWLQLCRKADVPFLPAQQVAVIHRSDYFRWDTPGEHHQRLIAAHRQVVESNLPNHMIRFDCCAPIETKIRLSIGQPDWHPDMAILVFDDPRLADIMAEHPREAVPIWRRPWLDAEIIDQYPVEYRTYVKDGAITGISNYYPQRPLEPNEEHIRQVREITQRLIDAATPPFLWNNGMLRASFDANNDQQGIHLTADYILPKNDDALLFLEGGPPHELGAHPCCFPAGRITGIAMHPNPG